MDRRAVSGVMLTLLFIGILTLAFNIQPVNAEEFIYIRADGSVDPPTAPIATVVNDVYIFTSDIIGYTGIIIERSNIIVDGNGYSFQGTGTEEGFNLSNISNVTIRNSDIKNVRAGIYLRNSSNNTISGNNITNNYYGIFLSHSSNNNVSGNNVTLSTYYGIYLYDSSEYNSVSGNKIRECSFGGIFLSDSFNNSVSGNNLTGNKQGIEVISSSEYNSVSGNNVTLSTYYGIWVDSSSNNNVSGNNLINNKVGIWVIWSSNNSLSGNNIASNNAYGIYLENSSNNTISRNSIMTNNYDGIYLHYSPNNTILGNNIIANNHSGIYPSKSSNNSIYHNNFINNTLQVYTSDSVNFWDDGYPSGGNYWSDYIGNDTYSGPYQNETGSDGIGDNPYIIDGNKDRYPLMKPWPTEIAETTVNIAGKDYTLTIESNATITHIVATKSTLHFATFGPTGTRGYINVTFPMDLNKTAIKVFVDGEKITPPPFPIITSNATHYFIYLEFTLSTHEIIIQYAIADIAITNITPCKTIVGQGYTLNVNVTIQNQGHNEETFDVSVFYDDTIILLPDGKNHTTTTLTSGSSTTLTIPWNTTGVAKGNYTITAKATPLPSEIDTTDNTFTDGWVTVAMIGDITGPDGYPDGKCDIRDIARVAIYFGQNVPPAPPNCDITGPTLGVADGKIDIRDIAAVALHFGETDL